jgi:hypothetical protein
MNRHVRALVIVLGCSLLGLPSPLRAAAIDQLRNLPGGNVPAVPEASGPSPVEGSGGGQSTATSNAAAEAAAEAEADAELDRLEAEYLAKQERAEQERLAREAQERKQREEAARQEQLRTLAVAAHQQWLATDERNGAAFDDVFAPGSDAGATGDPNVVDLSSSVHLAPALLRGNAAGRPSRLKPPPPPVPDFTLGPTAEEPPPSAFWWPDFERKTNDTAFACASMYLKSKVRGLGTIPEKIKDSLELRKKLAARFVQHIASVFAIADQATDPRANWSELAERSGTQFKAFASAVDEESRNGIRDTLATSGSGALPEDGAEAAEFGIAAGREHLQDFQEYKKWCDENRKKRR